MRTLTDHIVEGDSANHQINILVTDEPGAGGANHEYIIELQKGSVVGLTNIHFQNGPIKECGVNGVTGEALAAIQIDRLRSFQAGPYACEDNALALENFENGLYHLQARTRARIARGVEGTHQK